LPAKYSRSTHLRALTELVPHPRYFNLLRPTETNVCTYHEVILPVPPERTTPYPIGKVCSHLRGRVVDDHGVDVTRGGEGELCIAGAGVMQGYWALPEQTARGFFRGSRRGIPNIIVALLLYRASAIESSSDKIRKWLWTYTLTIFLYSASKATRETG
jgi:non-ribosomal peptide synthetase component F